MGKLTPLDLESAKKGYAKFLKINKLKEGVTPKDAELATKKAKWETTIADRSKGGKKKDKPAKEVKASKKEAGAPRESKKYDYPKGCDSKADRKKHRAKMRSEAKGGAKKAKPSKEAPVEKVSKKKSKKVAEVEED